MATFGTQSDETIRGRYQPGDTQTGTRAEQCHHDFATAVPPPICITSLTCKPGKDIANAVKSFTISKVQAKFTPDCFDRKSPVTIRHADIVAVNRVGNVNAAC